MVMVFTRIGLADDNASPTHELDITLQPDNGEIRGRDRITLPGKARTSPDFLLNAGLALEVSEGDLLQLPDIPETGLKKYRVRFNRPVRQFTIRFHGAINTHGSNHMDGMPAAIISKQGAYLDGSSAWYPRFDQAITGFTLSVKSPADWKVISQGRREVLPDSTRWTTTRPQQEIYLLAGPFHRYARDHRNLALSVYLLDDDPALAERYLAVMGDQIDLYSRLIGTYPYEKFAVVENRWQTGYGMPSFTLLGSRVIRLPFIPYTSLPHEILHNWWGNGVWVDYPRGNWSEGLTAYLADHLMKEREGKGAEYRRKALERYANFAAEQRDFPLIDFRARHNEASQAVGYAKSLMLFHMLRQELGDDLFRHALQDFWQDWQFRRAGFTDLLDSFARTAGHDLDPYLDFLNLAGAPKVALTDTSVDRTEDGYRLSFSIAQTQPGAVYQFNLPVAVSLQGESTARLKLVPIEQRETRLQWDFPLRPARIDIDPAFDVFRLLDERERPPSLGQLFGAKRQWLVLPTKATVEARKAWQDLADVWQQRYGNIEVIDDSEADTALPADAAVWLLGWDNAWLNKRQGAFSGQGQQLDDEQVTIGDDRYPADAASIVLMGIQPGERLAFIGARHPQAIDALARKLPHYSGYGRLVFERGTHNNILRESLTAAASPLSIRLSETAPILSLPVRRELARF